MSIDKENILNFKDLSEEEKEKYIEFLSKNNIIFEKSNQEFCATIKLKKQSHSKDTKKITKINNNSQKQITQNKKYATPPYFQNQPSNKQIKNSKQPLQPLSLVNQENNYQHQLQPASPQLQQIQQFQSFQHQQQQEPLPIFYQEDNNQYEELLEFQQTENQIKQNPRIQNMLKLFHQIDSTPQIKQRQKQTNQKSRQTLARSISPTPKKLTPQKQKLTPKISRTNRRSISTFNNNNIINNSHPNIHNINDNKSNINTPNQSLINNSTSQQTVRSNFLIESNSNINNISSQTQINEISKNMKLVSNYSQNTLAISSIAPTTQNTQRPLPKDFGVYPSYTRLQSYSKLKSLMQFLDMLRPSRWPKHQLQKTIEEIYNNKFKKYTSQLRKKLSKQQSFPEYIYAFFIEKYKTNKKAEQNSLNLIASLEFHINAMPDDIKMITFQKFLTEEYTDEELSFFLFVRQMIEKDTSFNFEKFSDDQLSQISIKEAQSIALSVFGQQEETLVKQFIKSLQKINSSTNSLNVNVYYFLQFAIQYYREMKNQNIKSSNNNYIPEPDHQIIDENERPITNNNFATSSSQENTHDKYNENPFLGFNNNNSNEDPLHKQQQQQTTIFQGMNQSNINKQNKLQHLNQQNVPSLFNNIFDNSNNNSNNNSNCTSSQFHLQQGQQQSIKQQQQESFEENVFFGNTLSADSLQLQKNNSNDNSSSSFNKIISLNKNNNNNNNQSSESGFGYLLLQQKAFSENDKFQIQNDNFNLKSPQEGFNSNQNRTQSLQPKTEIERKIIQKMEKKVEEFVELMMKQENDVCMFTKKMQQIEKMKQFEKILKKKTFNLLEALFISDKIKWLSLLLVTTPSQEQLQHVENLQKDLRNLNKCKQEIKNQDLSNFCKKILQTPELATAIGKLLICLSIPDQN